MTFWAAKQIEELSKLLKLDLAYFLKGGFWIGLNFVLSILGGLILSSLFARLWPADVYGKYSFLMAVIGFVSVTALPGMGQVIIQTVAQGKEGVYKSVLKKIFFFSQLGSAILFSGALYFFFRQNFELAWATLISGVIFPFFTTSSTFVYFLNGKREYQKLAVYSICTQLISVLATAISLFTYASLPLVTLVTLGTTALVNSIITISILKKITNSSVDKKMINLGMHLSLAQVFTIGADYSDRFIIPFFLGFTDNAIYAFAILLPTQLHSFFKIFTTLGQPKIATLKKKNLKKELLGKIILLEVLILILVLIYILTAPLFFHYLFPKYSSAIIYSQIFAVSLLYFPVNLLEGGFIRFKARNQMFKSNFFYAFFTIFFLILLVPSYHLLGAVLAKVITRGFQTLTLLYLFYKTKV